MHCLASDMGRRSAITGRSYGGHLHSTEASLSFLTTVGALVKSRLQPLSCHQTGYMIIVIIIMINITITSYYNGPYSNRGSCDSCPTVNTSLWLGKANRITRNRSYVESPHEGQQDCGENLHRYIWRSVLIWLREDILVKFYCPPCPELTVALIRWSKFDKCLSWL